jgi:hypothetical protein
MGQSLQPRNSNQWDQQFGAAGDQRSLHGPLVSASLLREILLADLTEFV